MWLLADIGGSHTRLTFADKDGLRDETLRSFDNDDFGGFGAVLDLYLKDTGLAPERACFAMAGPVTGETPKLTNRDWRIETNALGFQPLLLNDLEALAMALPIVPAEDLCPIDPGNSSARNGQRLAVGIGTGMNVCALVPPGATLRAEYGHSPLPASLAPALPGAKTVEDLFSGRGFAAFCEPGGDIRDYSALIGQLCATLATQYLPLDGLFLAGGVARHVLSEAPEAFTDAYSLTDMGRPPVSLITSDHAALLGCHAHLQCTQNTPAGGVPTSRPGE